MKWGMQHFATRENLKLCEIAKSVVQTTYSSLCMFMFNHVSSYFPKRSETTWIQHFKLLVHGFYRYSNDTLKYFSSCFLLYNYLTRSCFFLCVDNGWGPLPTASTSAREVIFDGLPGLDIDEDESYWERWRGAAWRPRRWGIRYNVGTPPVVLRWLKKKNWRL